VRRPARRQPASPGRPFPLGGRTALPSGTSVIIEADTGAGFRPAGHATVGPDGAFTTSVLPVTTGQYRAVAAGLTSPPVTLIVLDRHISFAARPLAGHRVRIDARLTPATTGAPVVLELYLPEHFGWWPVQQQPLDRHSQARFTQPLHRRVRARVLLTLPDGATPLAIAPVQRIGFPRAKR